MDGSYAARAAIVQKKQRRRPKFIDGGSSERRRVYWRKISGKTKEESGKKSGKQPRRELLRALSFFPLSSFHLFRGSSRRIGLLKAVGAAELLAEAFYPPGGVNELLLAGKERMALAANIDANAGNRAAGHEGISAGTVNRTGLITRMNLALHGINSLAPACVRRPSPNVSRGNTLLRFGVTAGLSRERTQNRGGNRINNPATPQATDPTARNLQHFLQ
jgi:hypothetical protein